MVPALRTENSALDRSLTEQRLREDPWGFDFFQAVRLVALLQSDRAPVGGFADPRREVVRFAANPSLTFPASAIQELTWPAGEMPRMVVNFMGLFGPLGVLPHYYTQMIMGRVRAHDRTMRDFLDIFNHRAISLFYKAWEKYRFTIGYEREGSDPLTECLLDLVGLGTPLLRERQGVRDEAIVYYGGLYGSLARSETALRHILSDYFQVPVAIEQFVGTWRHLEAGDRCELETDLASARLGGGAVVGDEVWDQQSRARIKLGPLPLERYLDFLPNGSAYEPLRTLTRFFSGNETEFEVQLILKRAEVPPCEVGGEGEAAPQLGWLSWMRSGPAFSRDPGDTILLLT